MDEVKEVKTYHGVLCIDKPKGFTSFDVVAKLRGILKTRKIGHAGTLDPMATGVLPVFVGRATKLCDLLPDQDKSYRAQVRLGLTTDTLDITGTVLTEHPVVVGYSELEEIVSRFVGKIQQVPPMYSAVKVGGQKLVNLARRGIEVKREPRPVTVYRCALSECSDDCSAFTLDVSCSKGTYIRTLADDIGRELGCGAVLTGLRRTSAAGYQESDCVTLEQLEGLRDENRLEEVFQPMASALRALPQVRLNERDSFHFLNGLKMDAGRLGITDAGNLAVSAANGALLGIGYPHDGELRIRTILAER